MGRFPLIQTFIVRHYTSLAVVSKAIIQFLSNCMPPRKIGLLRNLHSMFIAMQSGWNNHSIPEENRRISNDECRSAVRISSAQNSSFDILHGGCPRIFCFAVKTGILSSSDAFHRDGSTCGATDTSFTITEPLK